MTPNKRGMARVRFLALKTAIAEEMEQGYNRSDIFQKHHDALQMSYSQFTRHVRKFILGLSYQSPRKEPPSASFTAFEKQNPKAPSKRHAFSPRPLNFHPSPDPELVAYWLSPVDDTEK
ncbi:TraK family protein [Komagataeibacter sp. SM21]|uniref:TraK family protein n=1 Tax=Komagataeibacter sp. SM21 TaxID=3242899 RepID=UPI00352732BB